jgi:hypothetical protein
MRRFTRLTNGFRKKLENHGHMVGWYLGRFGTSTDICKAHARLR